MNLHDIFEGISVQGNDVKFDYTSQTGVSTKMGKKEFTPYARKDKSVNGYTIYSVYSSDDEFLTDVLLAVKKKSAVQMDPAEYQKFITRTAIFISAKILAPNNVDILVTPKSSTNILNDLIVLIKARNPHIEFLPESFVKTADISKIAVDYNNPALTDKIAEKLEGIVRAANKTGKFEIKKALPQYRKFFKNFFEIVDPKLIQKFDNKNVCVLDDVLASGTTLVQIMSSVADYNPNNVFGVTLFKTK